VALLPHPTGSRYRRLADPAGPADIERAALDFRFRVPNRPPLTHLGSQAPHVRIWPLSRILQSPAIVSWGLFTGPTDIEPRGLDARFRAPNRPPSCVPGSSPSNSSPRLSPASYKLPISYSGRFQQVPPTSSPGGSMLGVVRQTGPPCAYWALASPTLQLTPLPLPTSSPYRIQVESSRLRRHRAQGARYSVPCAKPGPLVRTGLQPLRLFTSPLSRFIQAPHTVFRSISAGSTDIVTHCSCSSLWTATKIVI
jgi:hypothetical protein